MEAFSNIYLSSEGIIYSIKYQDGEEGLKASIDKVLSYDYKKNNYIKYQHEPLELTDIYDDNFLAAELAYEKILMSQFLTQTAYLPELARMQRLVPMFCTQARQML